MSVSNNAHIKHENGGNVISGILIVAGLVSASHADLTEIAELLGFLHTTVS